MNYKKNNVYTLCYNTLNVFYDKLSAKKFYRDCYFASEGAEQKRYSSILIDLDNSNIGKDHISDNCYKISIEKSNDKYININLNKNYNLYDAIKYYEEILEPLINVSDKYNIDFDDKIPFENFGSDEESNYMNSFSNYYKEILEYLKIDINNINTTEISDGKYEIKVNDEIIDIRAWDDFKCVVDSVESIINKIKEKGELEI